MRTFRRYFLLFTGLFLLCYPVAGRWVRAGIHRRSLRNYEEAAAELSGDGADALLQEAEAYNAALAALGGTAALASEGEAAGFDYEQLLNTDGSGLMGYLAIGAIHLTLPIYHGTSAEALREGAGHLKGSSLPVGGKGTHSVIAAHSGMPGETMFTELGRLQIGDTFTVTVLNRQCTYEVDQILVRKPTEWDALSISPGCDYCTLLTCTPYGINSHRLLVRGRRCQESEKEGFYEENEKNRPSGMDLDGCGSSTWFYGDQRLCSGSRGHSAGQEGFNHAGAAFAGERKRRDRRCADPV